MATKINVRSPYFIKVEDDSLASAILSLYVYEGTKETDKPASAQYTITKNAISNNNFVAYEVSELVRDYINVNFNQERTLDAYIQRVEDDGGIYEENSLLTSFSQELDNDYSSGTIWVEADVTLYPQVNGGGTAIETRYFDYIAFDGYTEFEDGLNAELSRTLLQSNTDIYYKSGQTIQVPVFSDEVTSVKFYNGATLHTTVTVSESQSTTGQIIYASSTSATTKIEVISDVTETINVYETTECKYTPYKVTFVNRFGALQNIYFFKKSTESLNTTQENYKANIVDLFALEYDTQRHQYQTYNKMGRESITMNTGFVTEEYNKVLRELLLSEQVWMTKGSDILPMTVKTSSLQYKTSLNDKLINYSIDFEYAFDKINNIR